MQETFWKSQAKIAFLGQKNMCSSLKTPVVEALMDLKVELHYILSHYESVGKSIRFFSIFVRDYASMGCTVDDELPGRTRMWVSANRGSKQRHRKWFKEIQRVREQ